MALNSDQLGQKGEARFREICSDAGLTCNQSTYDRTGWDFIVEFPFQLPDLQSTLDKRYAPISCHVQVKTMWESNDEFRMRLSSAERLAKETKPAFVYVLKVNEQLEFVSAHLVHMLDENLAAVLRRLRQEQAKGVHSIERVNKKTISFRASRSGQVLYPTGQALRKALGSLCGPDLNSYIEKKRDQLANLGFDASRFQGKTTFLIRSDEKFVDALLGLKEIELTEFEVFERRFGIALQTSNTGPAKGTMHIQPNRADQCTIIIREEGLRSPAVFEGDIFLPSMVGLPREERKFLVKSSLFQIVIEPNGMQFTTSEVVRRSPPLEIDAWINFFKMLVIFSKGIGDVMIQPRELPAISLPISIKSLDGTDQVGWDNLLEALERARELLKLAGAAQTVVDLASIEGLSDQIIGVSKLFSGTADVPPLVYVSNRPDGAAVPERVDALLISFMSFGEITLAYYAVMEMVTEAEPALIRWRSCSIKPREIAVIKSFPGDYQKFVDRAKTKEGIDNTFMDLPRVAPS
jgi:hypothetical protein